ncbi:YveK family protein [Paenibacillus sedimenti]|uniref:Lipopolysaccharide biosynthesis protein n=1 Tax=Paenibacillus sedimenti TaxID=2770274 RepID=A0A926KMC6_9BACL|nr:Wzz/FepE/Etk N-terminal domain-containing protein [Paenibacillus sedimenti]MBD0379773.1 lipopolysaccharide biosynthesis protein [Paenibacillus sedimenti]
MELELKEYVRIVRRRLWIIISLVLISTMTTGIISYYFIQPVYTASAKLIVNKSEDNKGKESFDYGSVSIDIKLVNTYKEIIKTPAIMDRVVERYPEINLSSEALISKVRVSSVNETQVMTISAQDQSQKQAVRIVNAISEVFQSEISTILKVDNVTILNRAKESDRTAPISPNPTTNIGISFLLSLLVSIGIALLLEYMDDTIKTEKDIENYLGIPTLGVITKIKPKDVVKGKSAKQQRVVGDTKYVNVNQ